MLLRYPVQQYWHVAPHCHVISERVLVFFLRRANEHPVHSEFIGQRAEVIAPKGIHRLHGDFAAALSVSPNPFNPETTISYTCPRQEWCLWISTIAGDNWSDACCRKCSQPANIPSSGMAGTALVTAWRRAFTFAGSPAMARTRRGSCCCLSRNNKDKALL